MSDDNPAELLARWQRGDERAADELFQRYGHRLVALARKRVAVNLAPRFDPEDVVQSAYRSFFAGAREGRYEVEQGQNLWQLLVTITLRKLHHQVRWNKAEKRTVEREKSLDQNGDSATSATAWLAQEPSPMEAVALVDELQQVMRGLDPAERRMFELRLQGNNVEEIAAAIPCSECTVRRFIKRIRQDLQKSNLASPAS